MTQAHKVVLPLTSAASAVVARFATALRTGLAAGAAVKVYGVFGLVALLLVGIAVVLHAGPVRAEDLDAGKSGQQLFATNCSTCHRTPRGLAKTNRLSLFFFLRQHYTTSQASAGELTAYLLATSSESGRTKQKSTMAAQRQATASGWVAPSAKGRRQPEEQKQSASDPYPPPPPAYPPDVPPIR